MDNLIPSPYSPTLDVFHVDYLYVRSPFRDRDFAVSDTRTLFLFAQNRPLPGGRGFRQCDGKSIDKTSLS